MSTEPLIIWRLIDGKPGHMQQSLGLVRALQAQVPCEILDIDVTRQPVGLMDVLLRRFPGAFMKRRPHLVIGAGHATHFGLLAAKRVTGAFTVVLMKPSLPQFLFDLVVVPEHDEVPLGPRIAMTRGVLNPMRPGNKQPGSVVMLLGGESKHAGWDDAAVLQQVEIVAASMPDRSQLTVADSRRTPDSLSRTLHERFGERFQAWDACPPGWLADTLAVTETVWVTEDSVSMVYEALTAGCRVGLLKLPEAQADSRVMRGISGLVDDGVVTRFNDWYSGQHGLTAPPAFNEAGRVAELVLRALDRGGRK
ncbi:MAG: mitochondrial fission ELM1 family protein [Gammaproteobacteria bacterium]